MDKNKMQLKIFDDGKYADGMKFKVDDPPRFFREGVEAEIENLRSEFLAHFKGKTIQASLFSRNAKTEFTYKDIGRLMVHHLGKVRTYFLDYYRYIEAISRTGLFVLSATNREDFPLRDVTLAVSFPSPFILKGPDEIPREPKLTIFDRIPGMIPSLIERSFLKLLDFDKKEDAAVFLDEIKKRENKLRQFCRKEFHEWNKDGAVATVRFRRIENGAEVRFPVCIEIPSKGVEEPFSVACSLSAANIPVAADKEFFVTIESS